LAINTVVIISTVMCPRIEKTPVKRISLHRCIDKQLLILDIQETDILCATGNEGTTCCDVITHQDGAELIGALCVLQIHAAQNAIWRVQRGRPQLGCTHLTQTRVALDSVRRSDLAPSIKRRFQQLITLSIGVGKPWLTLAPLELVQRWISQEYMAFLNQLRHEAEEQSQQQGSNVLTIDVGVGHEHNLVVAQLGDIKLFVDTRAKRSDDCLDF